MKKIFITSEQLDEIKKLYDKTVGTNDWYTEGFSYRGATSSKGKNGWFHTGYYIPTFPGYIKTIKGITYIYSKDGEDRIELSDRCKELLNIA